MNASPSTAFPAVAARLSSTAMLVLCVAGAGNAAAQEAPETYSPDAALLQQVETMARSGASAVAGDKTGAPAVRVEVKVGKLDSRLKLAPCARIEPYLPPGLPLWGATRMGLRCVQGAKMWNVSLPITVSVFRQATVAKDNLSAGTVLDSGHLMLAEVDVAAQPGAAVAEPGLVLGRVLARNIAAGATLRQPDLKARQFFAAGETVRVTALGPGWQVVTEAQAVSPGIEGQTVRVRTESGRLLNVRPSGDRQVELTL